MLYRLADEMDERGGRMSVVLSGYQKPIDDRLMAFNNGALASRFRRRYDLPDFSDDELIEARGVCGVCCVCCVWYVVCAVRCVVCGVWRVALCHSPSPHSLRSHTPSRSSNPSFPPFTAHPLTHRPSHLSSTIHCHLLVA